MHAKTSEESHSGCIPAAVHKSVTGAERSPRNVCYESAVGSLTDVRRTGAVDVLLAPVSTIAGLLSDHSELRPQPIGNSARDLRRRLLGDRKYRTDVDLAKHVALGPVSAGRAEHEVRVPDHREVTPRDVQQGDQLWRPLVFHQSA